MAVCLHIDEEDVKLHLAYAYRIIAHLGMDDLTYTHMSSRSRESDYYYLARFGLMFSEIWKEDFLEIHLNEGNSLRTDVEPVYNRTAYIMHGAIYRRRPEVNAIFHLHTPATVAVSAMEEGLLPISQWGLHFYDRIAYHRYGSLALVGEQGGAIAQDLGDMNVMFLQNHGMVVCGKTVHEAMFYAYHLEQACKVQCMVNGRKVIYPNKEICKKSVEDLLSFEKDIGARDWQAWRRLIDKLYPLANSNY